MKTTKRPDHIRTIVRRLTFAVLVAFAGVRADGREEQRFESLSNLVAQADYIVIAAVQAKSPVAHMDGWVEYRCRFVYWLKAPMPPQAQLQAERLPAGAKTNPLPLFKHEGRGLSNWPPGAPAFGVGAPAFRFAAGKAPVPESTRLSSMSCTPTEAARERTSHCSSGAAVRLSAVTP